MAVDFELARHNMIEQQVRPWDVIDARVLEAMGSIRREDFVPVRHRKLAFTDIAIPLEHGESMMKPVVEGRLLQALEVGPEDDVLEIGTGSGFVTACLARLSRYVTSIEIHADMAERAKARLAAANVRNVRIEAGDALAGFDAGRTFSAVAVTGAVTQVPQRFKDWVAIGGRLFVIEGHSPAMQAIVYTRKGADQWSQESLFETDIDYLHGAEPRPGFIL